MPMIAALREPASRVRIVAPRRRSASPGLETPLHGPRLALRAAQRLALRQGERRRAPTPNPDTGVKPCTTVQLYDPFADAGFDDLFRGFFRPVRAAQRRRRRRSRWTSPKRTTPTSSRPRSPASSKDDIQVSIEGNQVTIAAEVKRETEQQGRRARAAQRALLRRRVPQLHAAGRARRGGERRRSTRTACSS